MNRVSGLPVNVAAMAVVTNIWRAAQALRSTLERTVLGEYGLTWASFSTLYIVWVWGPIEVRAIARSQGVSRATVTTTVDTLERRELVRRRREGRDRRLVTVELTPEGRSCIELIYPRFNEVEALLVADLSREQQESLAHLLRAVVSSSSAISNESEGSRRTRGAEGSRPRRAV